MKILFVGETWNGSSARSLREALAPLPDVTLDDLGEDHFIPRARSRLIRGANRLLRPLYQRELVRELRAKVSGGKPAVVMVYKGARVPASALREVKQTGALLVNVFPDWSPHAYGAALARSLHEYDLVISTKPFHPAMWKSVYGYDNACVCVPHGYDPRVHLWTEPPAVQDIDVVLAATWRPQFHAMMQTLAAGFPGDSLRVAIMGNGWHAHTRELPAHWQIVPAVEGRPYGEWLRRGKIALAPMNQDRMVNGVLHHGDVDTTRTYELAAMGCFFLHLRTDYAQSIYDEASEVPMWSDAHELTALVRRYLPLENERRAMAARAHARAVPAYSIPNRAGEVLQQVRLALESRRGSRKIQVPEHASCP